MRATTADLSLGATTGLMHSSKRGLLLERVGQKLSKKEYEP
jgi:hypothetical protein